MPRQRAQVDPPGRRGTPLRPAAAPVNTFFRTPQQGANLADVAALGPFSNSLQRLIVQTANTHQERDLAAGRSVAQLNPDAVATLDGKQGQDLEAAFSKLVRDGVIPENASPLYRRGMAEAAARSAVGAYRRNVIDKLEEATNVVDEEGMAAPPADFQALLAQEWETFDGSFALQSPFGRAAAGPSKQQADQELLDRYTAMRGEKERAYHRTLAASEVSQLAESLLETGEPITAEGLQRITDKATELHGQSFDDPRGLVMDGLLLAMETVAAEDPGEALRLADALREVKIGPTKLGDDARHGLTLLARIDDYERQEERDGLLDDERAQAELRSAVREGRQVFTQPLIDALDAGGSVTAAARELRDQIRSSGQFGANTGAVLEDLVDFEQKLLSVDASDPDTVDAIEIALARGDAVAYELIEDGLKTGQLEGRDYAGYLRAWGARQSITPLKDDFRPYQSALGKLRSGISVKGYNEETQREVEGFVQRNEAEFNAAYDAAVSEAQGLQDPTAREQFLRGWLDENLPTYQEKIAAEGSRLAQERDAILQVVGDLHRKRQSAVGQIEEAFRRGKIDQQQRQTLLAEDARASDLSPLLQGPDFSAMLRQVEESLLTSEDPAVQALVSFDPLGGGSSLTEQGAIFLQKKKQQARDMAEEWLDANLPTMDPGTVQRAYKRQLRSIGEQIQGELFTEASAPFGEAAEEGATIAEATAQAEQQSAEELRLQSLEARHLSVAQTIAEGRARDLSADDLSVNPNVPSGFYGTYARYLRNKHDASTHSDWSGWVSDDDFKDAQAQAAREVLANQSLPREARRQAAADIVATSGLSVQSVLSGKVQIRSSARSRTAYKEAQESHEQRRRELPNENRLVVGIRERSLERMRERAMWSVTLDLEDIDLDPFGTRFFGSEAGFRSFVEKDESTFISLLERLGLEDTPENRSRFIASQLDAIARIAP